MDCVAVGSLGNWMSSASAIASWVSSQGSGKTWDLMHAGGLRARPYILQVNPSTTWPAKPEQLFPSWPARGQLKRPGVSGSYLPRTHMWNGPRRAATDGPSSNATVFGRT